jgi:hypothetical protein
MQEFKAYAAPRAKGPLEPFSFTPGPLERLRSGKARYRIVLTNDFNE